jgi:hypothetical protein
VIVCFVDIDGKSQVSNSSYISWQDQVTFQSDDDDVPFVLDQQL